MADRKTVVLGSLRDAVAQAENAKPPWRTHKRRPSKAGVTIPRTSRQQCGTGNAGAIHHVAMYVGGARRIVG